MEDDPAMWVKANPNLGLTVTYDVCHLDVERAEKAQYQAPHISIWHYKLDEVEDFLAHYGVVGMKWGVRKDRTPGVSSRVDRDAKKDAEEFARAKMFYGDGAGTRRKLVKAKVEDKSKRSPEYKKAFDNHLSKQNMSKHAEKAIGERKRTDRTVKTKQRAGAIARRATGEMGTQAAFVAVGAAGLAYVSSPKGAALRKKAASSLKNANESRLRRQGAAKLNDYLRSQGL